MKIVVTGALGHIGSQLIRDLSVALPGCDVVIIDNLLTQRYCSLFALPENARYNFVEADIFDCNLDNLIHGADCVVHLAAITDATGSFDKTAEVERVNFDGTRLVAEACARQNAGLIFLSTTSVYGDQADIVDEECLEENLKPQSPYADSKLKSEKLLKSLAARDGLRYLALRFGTIVGSSPGMRFHTAVNKFIWQACQGIPLTVWTTARYQKRPYLTLKDACDALLFLIKRNVYDNELYNILTANLAVQDIVDIISEKISDVKVELVDSRIMNQLSYEVQNQKVASIGYQPRSDIRQEIHESISLLKNIRSVN